MREASLGTCALRRIAAGGLLGVLALGGEAAASGYALREQSAVGQGSSFAGATARGDDPSLLFFNPATLALLPGIQAAAVATYVSPFAEPESATATRTAVLGGGPVFGGLGGDATADAIVPAVYATARLTDQWSLGLAVTAPWGLVTKYDSDFVGRYHALTSELRTINVAPTIGWRPLPNLAIGAALQIQYADARLSNAVDLGSVGFLNPQLRALGLRPGSADARATVTGDDTALGVQLGAIWEPVRGTRLGLSWRSSVSHELEGEGRFENVAAPLAGAFPANTRARAKLTTPDIVGLGLSQAIGERWTLLADISWTNWSRFRELRVEFDNRPPSVTEERWRDTVSVSLGAEYRWSDALKLRAGVAYDPTPVREGARTPRIPDSDRTWFSLGASWQVARNVELTAAYTHIFTDDAPVRLADRGPGTADFLRGNLDAAYDASVDILALQARIAF